MGSGIVLIIGVFGLLAVGVLGGLLAMFAIWPRLKALERQVAGLERERLNERRAAPLEPTAAAPVPAPPVPSAPSAPSAPPAPPAQPAPPVRAPVPVVARTDTPTAEPVASPAAGVEPVIAATAADMQPEIVSTWEAQVGSNWLNKIGVLVVVIGLALAVSYSFTQLGPAGRVSMGLIVSLTMLAAGVAFTHRESFTNYGHGLVAGGWAGTYFTTYAMHGVEAARIIDSPVLGTTLLAGVAAAMFLHSLRYRTQAATGLSLIVVYVTLATSPLTWFALTAVVPIAGAVLLVAGRRGWTGMTALGIGATYALAALRVAGDFGSPLDQTSLAPFALLAVYWITFEAADLIRLIRSHAESASSNGLFALNAIGLVGAAMVVLPVDDAASLSTFTGLIGLGYLGSALLRRRALADTSGREDAETVDRFTTFHAAVLASTLLLAWSTGQRFDGTRLSLTWLLEAELLFAAGMVLSDSRLRAIGGLGIGVTTLQAVSVASIGHEARITWLFQLQSTTPVLLAVAAVMYLNREWIRRRGIVAFAPERGATWAAAAIVAWVLYREMPMRWLGVGWMLAAAVSVEAGLRLLREYRYQGYALGLLGGWLLVNVFGEVGMTMTDPQVWGALGGGTLVCLLVTARLVRHDESDSLAERRFAAGVGSWIGALLFMLFEWRVLPSDWAGTAWAATGYALVVAGLGPTRWLLRWQGYAFASAAVVYTLVPVVQPGAASGRQIAMLIVCVLAAYGASITGRGVVRSNGGDAEVTVRGLLAALATVAAAWLFGAEVRTSLVTLGWGLTGLTLLGVGFPAHERALRLSGMALLAVSVLKLFLYDLSELEAVPRILSFVVLGLVLLGVSWAYTRVRQKAERGT